MEEINIFDKTLKFFGHSDQYLTHLSRGGESNILKYAARFIDNGSTILDIGANIGFVSAAFSLANSEGTVLAIDLSIQLMFQQVLQEFHP